MADQVYIANGIISGLVLACGTVFSALMGVYFDSFFKDASSFTGFAYLPVWVFGFAYIVPGLIGLMATGCQAKGGYIAQMVFCILTLLAMGIFVVVALLALTGISYANKSCDDAFEDLCTYTVRSFLAVLYSIIISMILGWLLTLVITILGGVLACRPQPTPRMVLVPMNTVSALGGSQMMNAGWTPNMTTPQTNRGFQVEKY
ncbi:uncharacterized protein LOC124258042 isoform X3 [Haliotis rubra]|uniref:uncharacterized protein LOC124258042 isoform X3 n=1 Tax=Haliotis rubra TaxID=36100 RepID=UPI001EE52F3D|nr:uncharacterized protein LOC124258042 isoform X3 [Haliotis rubra]